jgi:hypothetical protein
MEVIDWLYRYTMKRNKIHHLSYGFIIAGEINILMTVRASKLILGQVGGIGAANGKVLPSRRTVKDRRHSTLVDEAQYESVLYVHVSTVELRIFVSSPPPINHNGAGEKQLVK